MTNPKRRIYATSRSLMLAIMFSYVGLFIVGGANLWYTNHVDRNSNQVWCDLINGLDARYSALPANASPDAIEFARQIAAIKKNYRC